MIPWNTAWQIASKRNDTKRGKDHLSAHAFEVLKLFAAQEAKQAMVNTIGVTTIVLM